MLSSLFSLPATILSSLLNFDGYRIFYDGYQQIPLSSLEELCREVNRKPKTSFLSNYLVRKGEIKPLYLFWDWDHKEVDIHSLIKKLQKLNLSSMITETRRGFHLYLFLDHESTIPTKSEKEMIAQALQIEKDDKQIRRKIFTLARVPLSLQGNRVVNIRFVQEGIKLKFTSAKRSVIREFKRRSVCFICPGVLEDVASLNPSHFGRFAFVAYLHNQGYSEQEILSIFEALRPIDFDREKTLYQIHHIIENQYVPPSCATLREMGYCREFCILRRGRRNEDQKSLPLGRSE
ncbi:MAG: hypothetical protein QIT35_gp08 [Methanophagales virus PBV299]|uniref:DNA primase large subunit C-terminal domain-containing protein n=1 Tax=Methanophagales virus PBV299 TaxID=2987730 RepID=A0ABY6GLA4_9CAUD|nr:MAG: hypothetical protein QIT35_gp08 [Methanophagales virus PBV299]UYL64804.1 MAG: hypothetical protein OFDIEDLO_00008 [Methanophagales virus PBV299]